MRDRVPDQQETHEAQRTLPSAGRTEQPAAESVAPSAHWFARLDTWIVVLLLATLLGAGLAYTHFTGRLIEINDATGYLYGGMRLAEAGSPSYEHPYNTTVGPYFTLNAFRVQRDGDDRFYLGYAPGYPALIAAARRLFPGWANAMFYVAPITAIAAALGAYALGCELQSKRAGLWAAILLLASPAMIDAGTRSFSDVPALACILVGYALFVRRGRLPAWAYGALAGALLGYACLIRQISVVTISGIALGALFWHRRWREDKMRWLCFALVFGLFSLSLLLYQNVVFGSPFRTGYSVQHHWIPYPAFSWRNFVGDSPIWPGGYRSVLETLWGDLGVLGLLAAITGLVTPRWRMVAVFGSVGLIFALVYAFYAWPANGVGSRFILPTLVMMRLFAAAGLDRALTKWPGRRWSGLLVGTALVMLASAPSSVEAFQAAAQRNADTADRVAYAKHVAVQTPADSVFISQRYGDHIILYGDRAVLLTPLIMTPEVGRYREEEYVPGLAAVVEELLARDVPVYVIDDGTGGTRAGLLDPVEGLRATFALIECQGASPPVFRVWLSDHDETPGPCWQPAQAMVGHSTVGG